MFQGNSNTNFRTILKVDFEKFHLHGEEIWKSDLGAPPGGTDFRRFRGIFCKFFDFVHTNAQNLHNQSAWNLCGRFPECSSMRKKKLAPRRCFACPWVKKKLGCLIKVYKMSRNHWFFDPTSEIQWSIGS